MDTRNAASRTTAPRRLRGFTMMELVVVMALLGLLLSIAWPRYMATLERGKHQILSHNLVQLREAIDKFHGDRGVFPDRLEDLVERRYLRAVPLNPFTEQADWVTVMPPGGQRGMVYDVKASAATPARDDPGAIDSGAVPASAGAPP